MDDAQQTVTVAGSHNVALNVGSAGRDVNVVNVGSVARDFINNQVLSNPQFFEPSLDDYAPDRWVSHPQACELAQLLWEQRLVFLAGDLDEKTDCARHLAFLLRKKREGVGATLQVQERCRGKEPQRIETVLEGKGAVVLLLDFTPRQMVYTVGELRRLLRAHDSYAILTTESSRAEWEGAGIDPQMWRELSWETYYGEEPLTELLWQALASSNELPSGLLPESVEGRLLVEGLPIATAVQTLRTPARVQALVQWLLTTKGGVTADTIKEQLSQMSGDAQGIVRWYREFEARDQLLVLGLTLFDGLPDDLLFAGLERLVAETWRASDPNLPQFDYHDLPRFATYFKQIESEEGFFRIQCASRERRQQILELAWRFQRRRLLAALPALTELTRDWAADAATPDPKEPARLATTGAIHVPGPQDGEEKRRGLRLSKSGTEQVHQALVESLSLIGLLSIDVVKPYFLDLVADRSPSVRSLAARALSAWRDGHDTQFLSLLGSWWAAGSTYESDDPLLARLSALDPRAVVRSAVALVVGYAARFDRPNRLAPELHRLLTQLVDDKDAQVKGTLAESTLWLAVAWHFRQLEPLLRAKVLKDGALLPAVAFGAAAACSMRPEESFAILDGWRTAAKADRRKSSPVLRERMLAAVALTYGYLTCDETVELLSPRAVGARLRAMLAEETNPFVRHYVFFAIELQAVRSFELVAPILQDLLSHISLADRPAAVEVFVRTYLAQRQRLPGGDRRILIGDRSFGVWTDASQRPLTEVEAALYSWILDDSVPIGQQLAVDIFEALGETALERRESRLPPAWRVAELDRGGEDLERKAKIVRRLPWLGWMAVFLAAPRKSRVRAILRPLLAEVVAVQARTSAPRAVVSSEVDRPIQAEKPSLRASALLARWRGVPNEATKAVARHLQRARSVYRWRWGIVLATILAVAALYKGAVLIYERLTVEAKPATEAAPAHSGMDADGSASPAPPEGLP